MKTSALQLLNWMLNDSQGFLEILPIPGVSTLRTSYSVGSSALIFFSWRGLQACCGPWKCSCMGFCSSVVGTWISVKMCLCSLGRQNPFGLLSYLAVMQGWFWLIWSIMQLRGNLTERHIFAVFHRTGEAQSKFPSVLCNDWGWESSSIVFEKHWD